jgi:hypothetical protein
MAGESAKLPGAKGCGVRERHKGPSQPVFRMRDVSLAETWPKPASLLSHESESPSVLTTYPIRPQCWACAI